MEGREMPNPPPCAYKKDTLSRQPRPPAQGRDTFYAHVTPICEHALLHVGLVVRVGKNSEVCHRALP